MPYFTSIVLSAVIIAIGLLATAVVSRRKTLATLACFSLLFKALVMCVHEKTGLFGSADIGDYWDYFAANPIWLSIVNDSGIERLSSFYASLYGGPLYAIFDTDSYIIIRSINVVLATLGCVFSLKIFEIIVGRPAPRYSAALLLFWPSLIRFSMELGRMPITIMLVGVTVYLALRLHVDRNGRLAKFVLLIPLSLILVLLRPPYGFIVFSFVLGLLLISALRIWKTKRGMLALVFLCPIVVITVFGGAYGYNKVSREGQMVSLDALQQRSERDIDAGSTYLKGFSIRNPIDMVWYTPLFGFYFLYSPLPWSTPSFNPFYFGVMAESMLLLGFTLIALRRRSRRSSRHVSQRTGLYALICALVFSGLVFGSGVSVAGQADRYRLPLTMLAIPFLAYFSNRRQVMRLTYSRQKLS